MVPIKIMSDHSLGFKCHDILEVECLNNGAFYGQNYYSTLMGTITNVFNGTMFGDLY